MNRDELKPGIPVAWVCKTNTSNGYSYILEVSAVVVKVGKAWIGIATAPPKESKTGYWHPKWVKPNNLKKRADQEANQ